MPEVPDAIDIDAEAVLREIVEQHGIFAEQSRGLFSFAHLTFQEYYVAKYLAESPAPDALDSLMARVTDDKWREVFLLTASLLPDATPFLAAFEGALHRLIAPRPPLVAWLRWIDEQAVVVAGRLQERWRHACGMPASSLLDRYPDSQAQLRRVPCLSSASRSSRSASVALDFDLDGKYLTLELQSRQ